MRCIVGLQRLIAFERRECPVCDGLWAIHIYLLDIERVEAGIRDERSILHWSRQFTIVMKFVLRISRDGG